MGSPSSTRRLAWASAALAGVAAAGWSCSGNHAGLGKDDTTATSAGAGGAAGAGGTTSTDASSSSSSSSSSTGAGGEDAGPPGPTTLTIVNGVADQDAIRLCFLPYPDGDPAVLPWPSAVSGLAFAAAEVVDPPADLVPEGVDVRPYVVAGDLDASAGLTCAEILAAAETDPDAGGALRVAALPVLPASVFASGRSVLFVATGCLGGPGHTDATETLGCGTAYTATSPTPGLVVLGMAKDTDPDRPTLQVVNASSSMPAVDVELTPGFSGAIPRGFATSLAPGSIGPSPPFDEVARADLGVLADVKLTTYMPASTYPTSVTLLGSVFANGGLGAEELVDGEALAFVAVGGYPGVTPPAWWHALTYVMVRADP
jgi:hypothetical protein